MAIQYERKEQEWLMTYLRARYPDVLVAASANGGRRDCKEAMHLRREGVKPGFPDLGVYCAKHGYHGLFIELKRTTQLGKRKGVVSQVQKNVLNKLNFEGYLAVVCWGWHEAKNKIDWYLN